MHTGRTLATLALTCVGLLSAQILSPPASARDKRAEEQPVLELHRNLQRDPLVVLGIWLDHLPRDLRGLAGALDRFVASSVEDSGADRLAGMLEAELLPNIGPEIMLCVDLPPIDEAVSALQVSKDDALALFLGRIGVVARVRDAAGLEGALNGWMTGAGAVITEKDGMIEAALPLGVIDADGGEIEVTFMRVYYTVRSELWALGFSPDWVRASLSRRSKGDRLTDGEDFKKVFARLDSRPSDLAYVNLPKLRKLVADSEVFQLLMQSNEALRSFVDRFLTIENLGVGLGSTSVSLDGGVRTTNFGPPWMSGTAVSSGVMAALAVPSLLAVADRRKSQQTLSDIQAIARACEGFSTDSRSYPGPTDGWVPVDSIARFLEPVYIGELPRTDGWENPILYWSDGGSYRILSTGRDGRMDRDWTVENEPIAFVGSDGDIVFGDGQMLAWPADVDGR